MNKQLLLHWAEVVDSWRIFPRLFLGASFTWTVWVSSYLLHWYTTLPKEDRSLEASGFASVVVLAIFGFMKLVFDSYVSAGRDWNQQPSSTHTTVASTTTTVQP